MIGSRMNMTQPSYFAVQCLDKPDSLALRLGTRAVHLDYIASLGEKIAVAGPYLDDAGNPCGSLLIFMAEDNAQAAAMAANDPYALAGLFESVTVRPWRWVINPPKAD
jgi:uncharacterized protein YciI